MTDYVRFKPGAFPLPLWFSVFKPPFSSARGPQKIKFWPVMYSGDWQRDPGMSLGP